MDVNTLSSTSGGVIPTMAGGGMFKLNSLCIVTGASRGLGREIAVQLAQEWAREGTQTDIVLVARSSEGLQKTKVDVEGVAPAIKVHLITADLGDMASLHDVFSKCVECARDGKEEEEEGSRRHQQFVLVHNAGTTGDITRPLTQQTDVTALQTTLDINFTSMSLLSSLFLTRFPHGRRLLINISSLLAKVPVVSLGLYSATRAARNALVAVLAVENPNVRFLTYTPGPCQTDMATYISQHSHSTTVREDCVRSREQGQVLSCQQSISKLLQIMKDDSFQNAAVIDYYDY